MYYGTHSFATISPELFGDQQIFTQGQHGSCTYSQSSSKKPPPANSGQQQKSTLQMNLCLVCNDAFLAEKAASKDAGLFSFLNLCNVLQVPSFQEFVTETNPLCTKCSELIDEYLKLQTQIKELMETLAERRKTLGKQLVDTYEVTSASMRNYQVKTKIYKIWHQKLHGATKPKGQPTVAENSSKAPDLENRFTEIVSTMTNTVASSSQKQQETNYTLLDISNSISSTASVSNEGISAAGSVADNDNENSNFSMECASPASPPTGFDDAASDNDQEEYVKNLNDEAPEESINNVVNTDNNEPTVEFENNVLSTTRYLTPGSSLLQEQSSKTNNEPQWIDKRKCRPIITTQRRTHPCKFCGKLFPAIFSLQMHERVHTGEKPFKCSICGRGFAAKAAMQKHERTHDKSRYEGDPQYECDLCGKKYHLERSLYTHKRDHLGIKRLKRRRRKYPKKKVVKNKDPNAPQKPKKPSQKKEGQPKKRPSRKKVKEIKLDEDGNPIPEEPKKPKCRKRSPKPPSNKPKRQFFLPRRKPGMPKEAICHHCGKDLKDGFRLKQHLLVHTGEKPLKCPFPECPKTFAIKGNLDKHMRTHDQTRFEGEPAHICDYCGKGFYVLGTLYHHRRRKHLGFEKKYLKRTERMKQPCECKICGKKLSSQYALSHHRVLHRDPKHKCEICEKPFYRAPDAVEHVKTHDPTWKLNTYFRIKCSACPPEALGFPSKIAIRQHWTEHHADMDMPCEYKKPPKPKRPPGYYICMLCPEGNRPTYTHGGSLLKHKKSFHSGKMKKWKPRVQGGAGRSKRRAESEDEMSSSENSSNDEVNYDSEKESENLERNKAEPVRRSARQTRGNTTSFAKLLAESDLESEEDVQEVQSINKSTTRVKFCPPKQKGKEQQQATKKPVKRGITPTNVSKSKLTESYIKEILGGRELLLLLCKVDTQVPVAAAARFTRNRSRINSRNVSSQKAVVVKSPRVPPASIKSLPTRNVAKRRGKPVGKKLVSESFNGPLIHLVEDSAEPLNLLTSYYVEEAVLENSDLVDCRDLANPLSPVMATSDNINPLLQGNTADSVHLTNTDVKDEISDDLSDSECLGIPQESSHLVITSTRTITAKRPNFSSMIIHNPLSKNKAANPIVFPAVPPARESPSESTHTPQLTFKKEQTPSENVDTDNEIVLGF